MKSNVEAKLKELGLELPPVPAPNGLYTPVNRAGNLVYTSGQTSRNHLGKLGKDFTISEGQEAAKDVILRCLACIKKEVGNLDKIEKIFKLSGYVNSAAGFHEQPQVINGASQVLLDVFGEKGMHARSAIGVIELPNNVAVEIELLVVISE